MSDLTKLKELERLVSCIAEAKRNAEDFALEHGLCFRMPNSAYGMGGEFRGADEYAPHREDYTTEEDWKNAMRRHIDRNDELYDGESFIGGWKSSSSQC